MGILVYSLLWVMQDLYHQAYPTVRTPSLVCVQMWRSVGPSKGVGCRVSYLSGIMGN